MRALILKPAKLMEYSRRFSPEVLKRYACDAAYHDIMPTWHVDFDAGVPGSGVVRRTHEQTAELCRFDRQLFGGPVVFEAADATLAGAYDGGCNHGVDTYRTPAAVAYELLKVHPKMSNHGFGYYERWLPWGYGPGWNSYVMTDRELDRYRATEVAFGRTGFIGQQLMQNPHAVVREYHLMRAFARAYTGRTLRRLAYFVDGIGWVDAAAAARWGALQRLRALYDGGQEVYVNLSAKPWRVAGRVLPPDSALTQGPRASAFTALVDGQIADFACYAGEGGRPRPSAAGMGDAERSILFADARSHQWLPSEPPAPITPGVESWKDNGDGSLELTLHWQVGRTLDRDYRIFWHFKEGGQILLQSDHVPSVPTSRWRVGEAVADGPHRVILRADEKQERYDLVVGLYDGKGRAPLCYGADQMRVGTLRVTRSGGKVTAIALQPVAPEGPPPGATRAPYLAGANREKKVLDFGPVATNGAVVIRPTREGREVVPVLIGQAMCVGLPGRLRSVVPYDAAGRKLPALALQVRQGKTWFDAPSEAARVVVRP